MLDLPSVHLHEGAQTLDTHSSMSYGVLRLPNALRRHLRSTTVATVPHLNASPTNSSACVFCRTKRSMPHPVARSAATVSTGTEVAVPAVAAVDSRSVSVSDPVLVCKIFHDPLFPRIRFPQPDDHLSPLRARLRDAGHDEHAVPTAAARRRRSRVTPRLGKAEKARGILSADCYFAVNRAHRR